MINLLYFINNIKIIEFLPRENSIVVAKKTYNKSGVAIVTITIFAENTITFSILNKEII